MNKHFKFILASAAIVAGLAGAVSCQDLKGELETLTNKVNALDSQVATLQQAFNAGKLITSVETVSGTPGGIKINFSDGSSQTITNGKNGSDGTAADVWTIEDGYWAKNGVKTEWKAVGTNGTNGTNGTDGADGKDGCYYVPNAETGCFDKYTPNADGEPTVEPTDISFVPAHGVAGVYDTSLGKLILTIDGTTYELDAFAELKSLVTIPEAYLEGVEAVVYKHLRYQPLVWGNAKDNVTNTVSDEYMIGEVTPAGPVYKDINPLTTVEYYVNPENADLSAITLADINAGIKLEADKDYFQTRAASAGLDITAESFAIADEDGAYLTHLGHRVLQVKYRITGTAATLAAAPSKISVFALSIPTASGSVSSDYVALYKQELNNLRIVDPIAEVDDKFFFGEANQSFYRPDPASVAAVLDSHDEHYRRAVYGMNFEQAGGAINLDQDAWIVKSVDPILADANCPYLDVVTDFDANGVDDDPNYIAAANNDYIKRPNFRYPDVNLVHLSADTTAIWTDGIDLMGVVAAHNWNGALPIVVPTAGNCRMEELDNDDLNDLGLKWRFEVVKNYQAGEPLTYQENFCWLGQKGNLDPVEVDPGTEVMFLARAFDADGGNPSIAAVGRHPVIRVSLIDPAHPYADGTIPVVESAYVKVLFVEAEPEIPDEGLDYFFHVQGSEGEYNIPTNVFTQADPTPAEVPFIGFTCDGLVNITTTVEWTNVNIYHVFGDKITFHNTWNIFNDNNAAGYNFVTLTGELGTVTEVVIANPATGATHVINWQITAADVWAIASQIDEPLEIVRHCSYQNAVGARINIKLHATIKPFNTTFDLEHNDNALLSDYIEQYWIAHDHDINVPKWGATPHNVRTPSTIDNDPALCTWVNDINTSFITNTGIDPVTGAADLEHPYGSLRVVNEDGVSATDVVYFFCDDNNVSGELTAGSYPGVTFQNVRNAGEAEHKMEHIHVRVSTAALNIPFPAGAVNYPAGQVLYAHQGILTAAQAAQTPEALNLVTPGFYQPVAVIVNNAYAGIAAATAPFNTLQYLDVEANGVTRNELALDLLNTDAFYAYLGATGIICNGAGNYPIDIAFDGGDCFKVDFVRPVSIDPVATKHFVDAVDFGEPGSFLRYEDIVSPYDWRTIWGAGDDRHFRNFPNYWSYYGVVNGGALPYSATPGDFVIHADLAAATCNLGGAGSPIPAQLVFKANEFTMNYPLDSWLGLSGIDNGVPPAGDNLTPDNDEDWLVDAWAAAGNSNLTIYTFNANTATPATHTFVLPADAANVSNYGYLTYKNTGLPVGAFTLKVPMVVYYKWGTLRTTITIEVATTI